MRPQEQLSPLAYEWYSTTEFAKEWGKHRFTVVRWCKNGFLLKIGFRLQRDIGGYWHIGVPVTSDAHTLDKALQTLHAPVVMEQLTKGHKVERIILEPVGEFWYVHLAIDGRPVTPFYDHKSHSEHCRSFDELLDYLGDQALGLLEYESGRVH